jgi:hypothetical protein
LSQQINLFNPIFLKQRKVFATVAMAEALAVLVAGILAVVIYGNRSVAALQKEANGGSELLAKKQAALARVQAEFAPRNASGELAQQVAQAEAQLHAMREVSGVLVRGELGNTGGFSEYFRALARQNGNGLWLTGVSIAGAGNDIEVRGKALEPTLVPGYIGRLAHEPVLRGKSFASLQISQAEPKKSEPVPYVEFSLQSAGATVDK